MEVKLYGAEDTDPTLLEEVKRYATSLGASHLLVAMHQRREVNGRPCAVPGSVTYDFIIDGKGDQPYSARQLANGTIICPLPRS